MPVFFGPLRATRPLVARCSASVRLFFFLVLASLGLAQSPQTQTSKPAAQTPAPQTSASKPADSPAASAAPQGQPGPGTSAAPVSSLSAMQASVELQARSVAKAQRAAQSAALAQQVASTRQQMAAARDSFWSTPLNPSAPAASEAVSPSPVTPASSLEAPAASATAVKPPATPAMQTPAQVTPLPSPESPSRGQVLAQAMAAVHQQWNASDDFFTLNWDAPRPVSMPNVRVPTAACPAMEDEDVNKLIKAAADHNDVAPELIKAVMHQESAFHPCAVSTAGAMGLMQLMPATADTLGVADPFAPDQNVEAGAKYLKQLLEKYHGDRRLALGAYNAGAGRVDQSGGLPDIPETIDYVRRIMDALGDQ